MRPAGKQALGAEGEPRLRWPSEQWCWWLQAAVLLTLSACLYSGVLVLLVQNWWKDPNFSHGFFVPLFSAYVVWSGRKQFARIPQRPSWWGLAIIAGALFLLIVGELGTARFLSRSSFVFLVAGLIIYFLGWKFFRAVLFPWAVLFLMIPVPDLVVNRVAIPLQLMAARLSSLLLNGAGVPVLREGNVIRLPAMSLYVAEACSGMRGLVSLGTLAIIYGYWMEARVSRRVVLAIAAVPIAVLANSLRIGCIGVIAQHWGAGEARGLLHVFSGWTIFVLSLGILFAVHRGMDYLHLSRSH